MPDRTRIGGSPCPDSCASTKSGETATSSSAPETISAPQALSTHTSGPVPLYLIAQAICAGIHEHGDGVLAVHIRRTRNHQYLVTLYTGKEEGDAHA